MQHKTSDGEIQELLGELAKVGEEVRDAKRIKKFD